MSGRWLDIIRRGDDAHTGAALVRLARLAARMHDEALGADRAAPAALEVYPGVRPSDGRADSSVQRPGR